MIQRVWRLAGGLVLVIVVISVIASIISGASGPRARLRLRTLTTVMPNLVGDPQTDIELLVNRGWEDDTKTVDPHGVNMTNDVSANDIRICKQSPPAGTRIVMPVGPEGPVLHGTLTLCRDPTQEERSQDEGDRQFRRECQEVQIHGTPGELEALEHAKGESCPQ